MKKASFIARLQRENLYAFVRLVFEILHPGVPFKKAAHVMVICSALEKLERGDIKRLLITVPPRHLKSITTAVAFCAFILGRDPTQRILVASYGGDLAAKHSRDLRRITESPRFKRLFPGFAIKGRDTVQEFETTLGGGRKAISVDGAATGFGADYIIVDDVVKAADARSPAFRERAKLFYDETLYSRLNDKEQGRIVVIQQRLHEDDIVQHLLDKGGWEHLNLPAIATERQCLPLYFGGSFDRNVGDVLAPTLESRETLDQIRHDMGSAAFSAQYQQDPTPVGGNRIRWQWFGSYDEALPRQQYKHIVQSWDTAFSAEPTSDWSVCLTLGFDDGVWDIIEVLRRRLDYPDLRRQALALVGQWDPDVVLVEDQGSGKSLVQELKRMLPEGTRHKVKMYRPRTDKETRVEVQSAKLEQGLIALPEEAPWIQEFKRELLAFPNGRHDDQVDALTQFLAWSAGPNAVSMLAPRDPRTGRIISLPRPRGQSFHSWPCSSTL